MIRTTAVLAAAVAVAAVVPLALLTDHRPRQFARAAIVTGPITPSPAGSIDGALKRGLFGAGASPVVPDMDTAGLADVPAVVGIVGRLPDQAIVLIRRASGGTRTIAIGDSADGWRLESIAANAVMFAQGARRERVEIGTGAAGVPDP